MPLKLLTLDSALCRCCKSVRRCRILNMEYEFMGRKEIYADMIMDLFGIEMPYLDGEFKDRAICATCVGRLRENLAFRNQMLMCAELFAQAKIYLDSGEESKSEVMVELASDPISDDGNSNIENCLKDVSTKESLDDAGSRDIKSGKKNLKKIAKKKSVRKRISVKDLAEGVKKCITEAVPETSETKNDTSLRKYLVSNDDEFLAEDNAITLIENSYIYPFKNRVNNYYCFYCKDHFSHPDQLSQHTLTHNPTVFKTLMASKRFHYVDTTRIDCRLCSEKIDSVEAFKKHVSEAHKKKIHFNISDRLLFFRLRFTELKCTLCDSVFNDFNGLNKHMVKHFSNYTCDVCGVCFLEEFRLMVHLRSHKAVEKHPCEVCGKVFKNKFYKENHVENVHNRNPTIRCPRCDEMFLTYTLKNKHLDEVHNIHKSYPCNMCDKVYDKRKTLTEHQRRTHLKVFKHQCRYCDHKFYLPSRLKEHMATHTGEREYKCEECDKSYPRLKSLRDHVRTHAQRARCHACGERFDQHASYRAHVKSVHPECDVGTFY